MVTISQPKPIRSEYYSLLRKLGAVMSIFSAIPVFLTLALIPMGSKFFSGLWLLLLGCLFLVGAGCYLIGEFMLHRTRMPGKTD